MNVHFNRLLNNIVVRNLQTNESWSFQYHSWLSIGQLVAEIPVYRVGEIFPFVSAFPKFILAWLVSFKRVI